MHPGVPVLNRYYGVFDSGKIKVRGIEAVRRDTPPFIKDAQMEIIESLAKASNSEEFRAKIRDSVNVLRRHVEKLMMGDVDLHDLVIARRLSMDPDSYVHDVFQAVAARQLIEAGMEVSGGQKVRYVITDAKNRRPIMRVKAAELINGDIGFEHDLFLAMNYLIL